MPIELPEELVARVQRRMDASGSVCEADVIRQALDSLDWYERERAAIQEGIDAWRAGDVQDLDAFDAEFRKRNGLRTGV